MLTIDLGKLEPGDLETLNATDVALKPRRIAIQSRFRVDRDVELLHQYIDETTSKDGGPAIVVSFSLGTDRNDLIGAWEKSTPLFEQRMNTIKTLCEHGVFVVVTLSPLGLWTDLKGTLKQLQDWGVPYITTLFFKEHRQGARTPARFLSYLEKHYPMLLSPEWQQEMVGHMGKVFPNDCVLVGQSGFTSLTQPHLVKGE